MTETYNILTIDLLLELRAGLDVLKVAQLNRCRRLGWIAHRAGLSPMELCVANGYTPTAEEEFAMHEGWERCRKSFEADEMPEEWKD